MTQTNHSEVVSNERPGIFKDFAMKQLFKRLDGIPRGRLLVEDGSQIHAFGASNELAEIKASIIIHDQAAYSDIAFGGSIGSAEAYMAGKWTSPNLVDLIRLMSINIEFLNALDDSRFLVKRLAKKTFHWFNRNTESRSKENISAHYDLSNEFFALFLDPEMMYSSAVFETPLMDLDEAAVYKLDLVCRKLKLEPSDHLLEIGSGWGGMAIYAARHYGCRVTTTTISREQYQATCLKVEQASLSDRVTVLFEDYRNLEGSFDKIVSIEMIEAVGHEFYDKYFSMCSSLLNSDGLMLLQAITIPDQRYNDAIKSVDFIQRYIFPGGSLPSHGAIMTSVKQHTDMQMVDMHEIGGDYARTLSVWRERFMGRVKDVTAMGFDDQFVRMWNYYLSYCQGAFEERVIGTSQILLAKPDWRDTNIPANKNR